MDGEACCSPPRGTEPPVAGVWSAPVTAEAVWPARVGAPSAPALVPLPGGTFSMGDAFGEGYPADGEWPVHEVTVAPFSIAPFAVTNDEWAAFVSATGFVTEAERYGWSFVFAGLLPDDFEPTRGVVGAEWWRQVFGADWRHPHGPHSDLGGLGRHPVLHVSWFDAQEYCAWTGTRLPTEAEWEYAARGGRAAQRFPWGDELKEGGRHRCNIWQGRFPVSNLAEDGYVFTAPVDAFEPNGFGLYNMCGNAWEWCADWFDSGYYATSAPHDPVGPASGSAKVMRGGSFLCHESYCHRYRVAARSSNSPDSSTGNLGFRVASGAVAQ